MLLRALATMALLSAGLAFAVGAMPAKAQGYGETALPDLVGGYRATVARDDPATANYDGTQYKTFKVSVALKKSSYEDIYRILIVYADCNRGLAAVHNSYTDTYGAAGGGQSDPLVSEYLEFEDQSLPDSFFGTRNFQVMCSLK